MRGYLADWDTVCGAGVSEKAGTPEHMDLMTEKGIVTPLTDLYALSNMVNLMLGRYDYANSDQLEPNHKDKLNQLAAVANNIREPHIQKQLLAQFEPIRNNPEQIQAKAMEIMRNPEWPFSNFLKALQSCHELFQT